MILTLGDNETGKTSLIAKMQGNEDPKKGSGLEYHYLLVRDEYRDEQTQLGVWVLDGDAVYKNLLRYALNEKNFSDTTILLVASMANPWNIMDSLEQWSAVLETHVRNLKMEAQQLNGYKKALYKRYQEYISPGDEIEGLVSSQIKSRKLDASVSDEHDDEAAVGDDVLTNNLGLDIVVVITKTDFMSTLEKEYDYKEESFDFIQQAIRKFCLKYGASLFYISAKINKNCDLLYKYLVHRIYGLPFKTPALVVEKDAVFIPSGWDNDKKIEILYENIQNIQSFKPDDNYNDVIKKPLSRKVNQKENEINCEDDQIFLLKIQSMLNQNVPSTPQNAIYKTFDKRTASTVSPIDSSNKAGEGVLQNFFNNLLNRKTNQSISPHTASPRTSIGGTSIGNTSIGNTSLSNTSLSNTSLGNASIASNPLKNLASPESGQASNQTAPK